LADSAVPQPSLADRILARDPRAIARAISLIEDEAPGAAELVGRLFAKTGRAYLIGVTGPPGAGKSTLVDRLTAELRKSNRTVGVVAVDPTSPYTGGAILGDRVRMQAHAEDAGVFIRSTATRGHLGGLAAPLQKPRSSPTPRLRHRHHRNRRRDEGHRPYRDVPS
jgi:LAO/AO transport system kinase